MKIVWFVEAYVTFLLLLLHRKCFAMKSSIDPFTSFSTLCWQLVLSWNVIIGWPFCLAGGQGNECHHEDMCASLLAPCQVLPICIIGANYDYYFCFPMHSWVFGVTHILLPAFIWQLSCASFTMFAIWVHCWSAIVVVDFSKLLKMCVPLFDVSQSSDMDVAWAGFGLWWWLQPLPIIVSHQVQKHGGLGTPC